VPVRPQSNHVNYDDLPSAKEQATAWIKAAAHFEAMPEHKRPKLMQFGEWKKRDDVQSNNEPIYVRMKVLETLKVKLNMNEPIKEEMLFDLISQSIESEESLVPVSKGVHNDIFFEALEKNYGEAQRPDVQAKAWVKAADYFKAKAPR